MSDRKEVRVLIAEDDCLVVETIKGWLEEIGYRVVGEAGSGQEAIDMTCSIQPDVVLMDVKMPDMDGIEAAQYIFDAHPTPVVVLTAHEMPELIERASAAGVGAYLVKPTTPGRIKRAIAISRARFEDMMALRRLNETLQARNAELDAFAHIVAHHLKGQLAPLVGYAEVLEMDYARALGPEGLDHVLKIMRIAHKMHNVTDELLLLAELRASEVPRQPLNMGTVVAQARRRLAYMIQEHQAELILPPREAWPTALGHAPWVEEVWVNFISNGIQHGGRPDRGVAPCLELGFDGVAEQSDRMVRFWIWDNGPGIPTIDRAQLFPPFDKIQVRARGRGLGLAIVRYIVEKLGGVVGVESEIGGGNKFWFALPAP